VKKVIFALLLVAFFVSLAVAADDNSASFLGAAVSPKPGHTWVNVPAVTAAGTLIFTTDPVYGYVYVWDTTGKQIAQITGFSQPQGLAVDGKGDLYIADTNNSQIVELKPPYTKTPIKLADPGYYPAGVAVVTIGKDTYVAASNICSAPNCTQGGFIVYKNGKSKGAFQSSNIYRAYFLDFDKKGNLYADGENSSYSVVVGEVPGAIKNKQTFNLLTYNNTIYFPGGVQVTSKGLIGIDDQEGYAVYTYKPPVKGSLGSPVYTTSLSGVGDAVEFALTANNKDLWISDYSYSKAEEFAYTAGGSPVDSFTAGSYALGVAVYPADKP